MHWQPGSIWTNGGNTGNALGTIPAGSVVGVAIDLDNRKAWFRVAPSGNWNSIGTDNPATNTGGATVPAGTMVPFVTFGGVGGVANNVITANFGASAFTGVAPSGFTSWPGGMATAGAVRYDTAQGLTAPQQAQARQNISALSTVKIVTFTASGTYTPTAGMAYCIIECIGAGGAGGGVTGVTGSIVCGGGGGSAGYSRLAASAATIGASKAVTVGVAVTGTNGSGGTGGDTSVGALCIAKGGGGVPPAPAVTRQLPVLVAVSGLGILRPREIRAARVWAAPRRFTI